MVARVSTAALELVAEVRFGSVAGTRLRGVLGRTLADSTNACNIFHPRCLVFHHRQEPAARRIGTVTKTRSQVTALPSWHQKVKLTSVATVSICCW